MNQSKLAYKGRTKLHENRLFMEALEKSGDWHTYKAFFSSQVGCAPHEQVSALSRGNRISFLASDFQRNERRSQVFHMIIS
ncbi:MAG: hypothetical protein R3B47_06860 [Bacteroidia bacterium]